MSTASEPAPPAASGSLARSTAAVSLFTFLSRLLGLARDWALVALFSGSLWVTDAFLFAFTIPNLFRRLFGEGALSAAFIPVFVSTRERKGEAAAADLASAVLTLLALVTAGLTAIGILGCFGADRILYGGAPTGRAAEQISLTLRLAGAMMPFLALICCSALLSAMLQGIRAFALPAAMSCLLNLCFLVSFGWIAWGAAEGAPERRVFWAALGVVAAGALQVLVQIPALSALGVRLRPLWARRDEAVGEVLKAMGPTVIGLGVVQVNVLVDGLIAYTLSLRGHEGANTCLYLGNRLMQLPLGVFGIAVATTSFSLLASHAAKEDAKSFLRTLQEAVRMVVFVVLPAGVGLAAVADPVVRLLFQRPDLAFGDAEVYRTAAVLACYAFGLVLFSLQQVFTRAFYALRNYSTPVRIAAWMVVVNLGLNLLLIGAPDLWRRVMGLRVMGLDDPSLGVAGLALATTLTALLNVGLLWVGLRARLRPKLGEAVWDGAAGELAWAVGRMALAAALMGVFAWLSVNSIPYEPEWPILLERALVPIALGILGYWGVCSVIPVPEANEFLGAWRRRRSKAGPEA